MEYIQYSAYENISILEKGFSSVVLPLWKRGSRGDYPKGWNSAFYKNGTQITRRLQIIIDGTTRLKKNQTLHFKLQPKTVTLYPAKTYLLERGRTCPDNK